VDERAYSTTIGTNYIIPTPCGKVISKNEKKKNQNIFILSCATAAADDDGTNEYKYRPIPEGGGEDAQVSHAHAI